MAGSTTNMGLVTWTSLTDFFSHTDLVNNWTKVDGHDHVPVGSGGNGGTPIPAGGIQNGAISNAKLANDAVATSNIQNGAVTLAKLGSDVDVSSAYVTYKHLPVNAVINASGLSTGTDYYAMLGSPSSNALGLLSGTNAIVSLCTWNYPIFYEATGRTTKLKLYAHTATNGTSHGTQTFTLSLVPVTAATFPATGGAYISTVGSPVTGSTMTITPTTSTLGAPFSSDFTAPGAGMYALRLTCSANMAANARLDLSVNLLYRQV